MKTRSMNKDIPERQRKILDCLPAEWTHQVRSPLNTIISLSELAMRQDPQSPLREYIAAIRKSAGELLAVFDDMAGLVDTEIPGREDEQKGSFCITTLMEDVREALIFLHPDKCRVSLEIDDMPECYQGKGGIIKRVLVRLLDFACRSQGACTIDLNIKHVQEHGLCVSLGIDAGDPWAATPMNIKEDSRLSVCRSLVEAMSGSLEMAESGNSLLITLTIPAQPRLFHNKKVLKAGFKDKYPTFLMINSDSFSSGLLNRGFSLEDIQIKNMASLEEAARWLDKRDLKGHRFVCLVNWKDINDLEDISSKSLGLRCDQAEAAFIVIEIPALEMMGISSYADGRGVNSPIGFVMKPSAMKGVLSELPRATGRSAGEIFENDFFGHENQADGTELLKGTRVLVVEDERINQQILLDIFRKNGIRAVVASNGKAAEKAIEKIGFDAIFMDIKLPDCSGYELTSRIRDSRLNSNTPVVALTASTTNRRRCLDAGMNDFLTKPYSEDMLIKTLLRFVR